MVGATSLGWALAVASPVSAEATAPLRLAWDAPASCPRAIEIERRVLAAVGDTNESTLVASGTIVHTSEDRYTLELSLADVGSRMLEAGSCEALADAAVFILAIAIDPRAAERLGDAQGDPGGTPDVSAVPDVPDSASPSAEGSIAEPPGPASTAPEAAASETMRGERASSSDASTTSPTQTQDTRPSFTQAERQRIERKLDADARRRTRARARHMRLRVDLDLSGGASFFVLPAPGGFVSAGPAVSGRQWRVALAGSYVTPSERRSPVNPAARGRFQLWSVIARGCWVPPELPFEMPLCTGLEVGGMHAAGVGDFVEARRRQSPWVAASTGVMPTWWPSWLANRAALGLQAEGFVAITRPRFGTEQAGTLFRAPQGGARVAAVITIRLFRP